MITLGVRVVAPFAPGEIRLLHRPTAVAATPDRVRLVTECNPRKLFRNVRRPERLRTPVERAVDQFPGHHALASYTARL